MKSLRPSDPRRLDRYRLEGRLGGGGMGQVYLARTAGGRRVVVKVIRPELTDDPEFRARFAREAEMARRVGGFHTAQVVDADPGADPPWIATAFVPGPSLEQAVREAGPLQGPELTALALGLAEGLEAIHGCGLVHRDLKPANILLAEDGPRIIDFGIARPLDATGMTRTGTVLGTLTYMSPEQVRGEPVGAAGDMFALGTVLVFAATGTNPFAADTMGAILFRVISATPAVDGLPERLRPLIKACWDHDPKQRPTPGELITALGVRGSEIEDTPFDEQEGTPSPAVLVAPTKREEDHPEEGFQEPSKPTRPSGTKSSVSRRRPLVAALGAVLIAGLVYWAVPSATEGTSPPEIEAALVVNLHEGAERAHEGSEKTSASVTRMEIAPDGSRLLTQDGFTLDAGWFEPSIHRDHLRLWDTTTGEKVAEYRIGEDSPPQQVLFSPEGTPIRVELPFEGEARLYDFEERRLLFTLSPEQGRVRHVKFTADGATILTRTSTDEVLEWDFATGEHLATHGLDTDSAPEGASSPGRIITDHRDGKVELRHAESDEPITVVDGGDTGVRSHAVDPDETMLATGHGDGGVRLWDTEDGEHTLTLVGHEEAVEHVVFGVDGTTLFAAGEGSILRMWKLT